MTIPDEVEERLRDYFAALLPPHAAHEVFADVLDRLPVNASPGAVFVAAHKALQDRVRVAPEVEADVLVEEAGLSVSDAAMVLGLRVRDVRNALEAAAAAAAALDIAAPSPAALHAAAPEAEAVDRNLSEQAVPHLSGTDSLGGDSSGSRVVIVVEEEAGAETFERVERRRAGAVLVLVLALVIAIAALVVAAQGT